MKRLLLLGAGGVARAQFPRPAARPDSLVAPLAAASAGPDTVAALHRLFAARRRSMRMAVPLTLGVGAGFFTLVAGHPSPQEGASSALLGVLFLSAAAGELSALLNYSKRHEREAVEAFERQRLPAALRRELKAAYFRSPKARP